MDAPTSPNLSSKKENKMDLQIRTMDDLSRLSKMFSESGFFSDTKDAAQAGVKILAGLEKGFQPFTSMTGFHIIQGKPAMGANLIAAGIKRSGKYDYRVVTLSDTKCEIEFFEHTNEGKESIGKSEFDLAAAKKAQVKNLEKFARNMLFARAISNGVRWFCPDVFDAPVYTPEELGANVDEEGNVIDVVLQEVKQEIEPKNTTSKLNAERARAMGLELEKIGFAKLSQPALVEKVLGRKVDTLTDLTEAESLEVWSYAKRVASQAA